MAGCLGTWSTRRTSSTWVRPGDGWFSPPTGVLQFWQSPRCSRQLPAPYMNTSRTGSWVSLVSARGSQTIDCPKTTLYVLLVNCRSRLCDFLYVCWYLLTFYACSLQSMQCRIQTWALGLQPNNLDQQRDIENELDQQFMQTLILSETP